MRVYRMVGQFGHRRNDAAGIQPRAQERSNRNVTNHLRLDSTAKALSNLVDQLSLWTWVRSFLGRKFQIPVFRYGPLAILEDRRMPRGKFADAAKHGMGIRNPKQSQILLQSLGVD